MKTFDLHFINRKMQSNVVIVSPLSSCRETLGLILVCAIIMTMMGLRFYTVKMKQNEIHLRPYQKLDSILTNEQRTLYRTLHSSVSDIINIRSQEGWWPETELLKQENIPPFDQQLLPKELKGYFWVGYNSGSWIDYLGQDKQSSITFILRLIDLHASYHPHPHPGTDYDPELSVAVQVWFFSSSERSYPGERLPEAGWFWLMREDDPLLKTSPEYSVDNVSPITPPL